MPRRSPLDEGAHARPVSHAATLSLCALALTGCATTLDGAASARRARARLSAPEFTVPSRSARIQRESNAETSVPSDGADLTNWSAALDALISAPPGSTRGAIAPARPWDHITAPRYIDRIDRRLLLSATDHEALSREGFAVLDRARASSWIEAWQIARQADLPIYVSADSILAAATTLHAPFVEHVEEHTLAPKLAQVLQRMHDALPSVAHAMPDEASTDVDLILTVARSLLEFDEGTVPAALGTQPAATELVNAARSGARRAERYLFGRPRVLDFSDYAPAGRRSLSRPLARYARATAWLSRVELNLVSRGCRSSHPGPVADPRETPREALTALALADLVERAGVSDDLARLDRAWTLLDGRRNDVSLAQINVMRDDVHIVDLRASDAFERFRLVARNVVEGAQPTFPGVSRGPAVASLFGVRRTALDAARVDGPARAAEAAYALGADRAMTFIEANDHGAALASARRSNATLTENDLPSHWLRALRGLATSPSGRAPSFMTTDAFADLRVNAVLASFGRFLEDGDAATTPSTGAPLGTPPTAWVDPTPETYRSIATYAERSLAVARAMFEWSDARSAATRDRDRAFLRAYDALWRVSRGLRIIADDELAGRTPTEEQRAFVTAVVDDGDASNNVATRGWYASLSPPGESAQGRAEYAATLGASSTSRERVWIGATSPRLGVFVIDNGGLPFAAVGPVARAWESVAPASMSAAQVRARAPITSPWSSSWMITQEPAPPLALTVVDDDARRRAVILRGGRDLGRVTIELLDARGAVLGDATRVVGDASQRVLLTRRVFPQARPRHARHHAHHSDGIGVRFIDNTRSQGAPQTLRIRTAGFWFEQPMRFERNEHFALGGMVPIDASGASLPESASE
jgi:Protein of unknown function (DUF3160)